MKSYNKNNLINWCIMIIIGLTIVATVACFYLISKHWYMLILPTVAAAYGCYAFYKKYHIDNIYKDDPDFKKSKK